MYLPADEIETDSLRQGDVIKSVHYFGGINPTNIRIPSAPQISSSEYQPTSWSIEAPPKSGYAMVLSHNCEIDRGNSVKVTSIVLAPIRDINKATSPEKIEELKATNLITTADGEETSASYLKYFYIEAHEELQDLKDGAIVDFSKCFSYNKHGYDGLLENKILQLRPEIVSKMSLKLGLYFSRS